MAYKRLTRMTGGAETPQDTWVYECDTEADVSASLPEECVAVIIATPGEKRSPVRIRDTTGEFREVKSNG